MNISQLEYFVAVAQMRSMNKAADSLFVSHQCLSSSIKKLENEIGCQLFDRTNQGAFLNSKGEIVYTMAKNILQEINDTKKLINSAPKECKEVIRINYSIGFNAVNFLSMIKTFHQNNSLVSIFVQENPSFDAMESLLEGKIDLAYIGVPKEFDDSTIQEPCVILNKYQEKILCLVPVNHTLAQLQSISFKNIIQYPLILYQRTLDEKKSGLLQKIYAYNSQPNIVLITDDMNIHNDAIADGEGIGFISEAIIRSGVLNDRLRELGLTTIKLKDVLGPQIISITTRDILEKKNKIILLLENEFKQKMWLREK